MCLFSTNASVANTGCDELVCGSGLAEVVYLRVLSLENIPLLGS